jgi:hypothetical protein
MLCVSFGRNPTLYDLDLWEKRCHIMRGVGGVFLFCLCLCLCLFLFTCLGFARFICICSIKHCRCLSVCLSVCLSWEGFQCIVGTTDRSVFLSQSIVSYRSSIKGVVTSLPSMAFIFIYILIHCLDTIDCDGKNFWGQIEAIVVTLDMIFAGQYELDSTRHGSRQAHGQNSTTDRIKPTTRTVRSPLSSVQKDAGIMECYTASNHENIITKSLLPTYLIKVMIIKTSRSHSFPDPNPNPNVTLRVNSQSQHQHCIPGVVCEEL